MDTVGVKYSFCASFFGREKPVSRPGGVKLTFCTSNWRYENVHPTDAALKNRVCYVRTIYNFAAKSSIWIGGLLSILIKNCRFFGFIFSQT